MKRTYNRTLFNPDLTKATIRLYLINDKTKDEADDFDEFDTFIDYTDVTAWDIVEGGKEAEELEIGTDIEMIDENHEYLVLHFQNDDTATFRNSHVVMFIQ